jgi:hypothetical protein
VAAVAAAYRRCFGDRFSAISAVVVDRAVGAVVGLVVAVAVLAAVVSVEVLVAVVISVAVVRAVVGNRIHRFDFGFRNADSDFGFRILCSEPIVYSRCITPSSTYEKRILMSNFRTRNSKSAIRNPKSNLWKLVDLF